MKQFSLSASTILGQIWKLRKEKADSEKELLLAELKLHFEATVEEHWLGWTRNFIY